MTSARVGLGALAALWLSCGGAAGTAGPTGDPREEDGTGAICAEPPEVVHPSHRSDALHLELVEREAAGMVIPPREFEVRVDEDLASPVEMELTIFDPAGRTHVQRLTHANMRERCDPICDRVVGGPRCPERRCWMERSQPPAIRIDAEAYRESRPGIWTFVLHRLDDGERVSVTRRLFEGALLEGEDCEALPVTLGRFRRVSCRQGVVPMGSSTSFWGIKARYADGSCRANAFALPLSQQVRTLFHEGPYGAAGERLFPEGEVHELDLEGLVARTWMAHHHAYVVAAPEGLPGYDGLVRALLEVFPDVDGPARPVPRCEATAAVTDFTVPPVPLERLQGDGAQIHTHFEGNRPSGARVAFHDRHPLALAGLRRNEIVHTVDGARIRDRRDMAAVLERLARPGRVELVVSRARVSHARCLRIRVAEGATPPPDLRPPPPDPPPPVAPRRGRHCERRSTACWDCVEFDFPAEIGCDGGCRGRHLCVRLEGRDQCLAPTRICCMAGAPCETPPGCDGAATSCASDTPGGRHERCTFLSDCPGPLPRRSAPAR